LVSICASLEGIPLTSKQSSSPLTPGGNSLGEVRCKFLREDEAKKIVWVVGNFGQKLGGRDWFLFGIKIVGMYEVQSLRKLLLLWEKNHEFWWIVEICLWILLVLL
jgi:hypothetical protein